MAEYFDNTRFSTGRFNMDCGNGGVKPLTRYSYTDAEDNDYDIVRDTAGMLMCSTNSGPWQEFRRDMHNSSTFAAIILHFDLEA